MDLSGKKVAVYGMGKSGISALKLLAREGADIVVVSKGSVSAWYSEIKELTKEQNCFEESDPRVGNIFASCHLIIISPGIPPTNPCLQQARGSVPIWSEIELGFHFSQVPVIAITGTNGKTTTVSLLGELLTSAGFSVFVGGNIGTPYCEISFQKQDFDFAILELSSFQLEQIKTFKPQIAVILNVTQNHGERYVNFSDYLDAKKNITRNLTPEDYLIISSEDQMLVNWAKLLLAKKIVINPLNYREMESFWDLTKFRLFGKHNFINLYFCFQILKVLGVDPRKAKSGFEKFKGVRYRLQREESTYPFEIFNDAKSTNFDATITALKSLAERNLPVYLILGGQKRGQGDSITPHLADFKRYVKKIFLIGETAEFLASELENSIPTVLARNLENTLKLLEEENHFEGILLFSPAYPSFDQFSNYMARGKTFSDLIKKRG